MIFIYTDPRLRDNKLVVHFRTFEYANIRTVYDGDNIQIPERVENDNLAFNKNDLEMLKNLYTEDMVETTHALLKLNLQLHVYSNHELVIAWFMEHFSIPISSTN
jgi:hypothetical protein